MAPMGLARVVKTKFWLSSALSLAVTLTLITLRVACANAVEPRGGFWRGDHRDDVHAQRRRRRPGRALSQPEGPLPGEIRGCGGRCACVLAWSVLASIALLVFGTVSLRWRINWTIESVIAFGLLSSVIGWLPMKFGLQRLKNFEA